jgi:opacity protein-like surface antigen
VVLVVLARHTTHERSGHPDGTQTGTLRDTSAAFQYFAGLRAHVTESVFVFGEYKYFASHYQWGGSLDPSLDLRTHIVAIGVGLSF